MSPRKYRTALNPTGSMNGSNLFGTSMDCTVPLTRTSEPFRPLGLLGKGIVASNNMNTQRRVTPASTAQQTPAILSSTTSSRGAQLLESAANSVKATTATTAAATTDTVVDPEKIASTQGIKRNKMNLDKTTRLDTAADTFISQSIPSHHVAVTDIFKKLDSFAANRELQSASASTSTSTTASPSTSSSMSSSSVSSPESNIVDSIGGLMLTGCSSSNEGVTEPESASSGSIFGGDIGSALSGDTKFSLGALSTANPFALKQTARNKVKRRGSSSRSQQEAPSITPNPFTIPNPFVVTNDCASNNAPSFSVDVSITTSSCIFGSSSSSVPKNPFLSPASFDRDPSTGTTDSESSMQASCNGAPTSMKSSHSRNKKSKAIDVDLDDDDLVDA